MPNVALRGFVRAVVEGATLAAAVLGAFWFRFDGAIPAERTSQLAWAVVIVVVVKTLALAVAGINRQSWQYVTLRDMAEVTRVMLVVSAALAVIRAVMGPAGDSFAPIVLPYGVIVADLSLSLSGLTSIRALRRVQAEHRWSRVTGAPVNDVQRAVLVGAGHAGMMTLRDLRHGSAGRLEPVVFVDDDPAKAGRRVGGLDVVGTIDDLASVVAVHDIDVAIITMARASGAAIRRVMGACEAAGLVPKIVPTLTEIVSGQVSVSRIRDVAPEDLLGRDQVGLDDGEARRLVEGRCVMVTGAGGSIGSELVRQVARLRPARLLLIDRAEPALWAIHREITAHHPRLAVQPLLADVCDRSRMASIFAGETPDVVLHAAAHKHVPMMEANPGEAVKNNIGGTKVVADLAALHHVQRFVLISTDKAVNPTSVMGATKRAAELYVGHVVATRGLHGMAVRFGNVLGSTGSVVPIFQQQVAQGGPVTVTHPDMQRYFMTIPEASQLVVQAAAIGRAGETLVLDMGEPVRILDLAEAVVRLSGLEPYVDIPIEFSGIRSGEKLFEELSLAEEQASRTRHPKIWIGSRSPGDTAAHEDLSALLAKADGPAGDLLASLRQVVRQYARPLPADAKPKAAAAAA